MRELLRRVHVREDPELTDLYDAGEMPAVLRVTLTDGTVHEVEKSDFGASGSAGDVGRTRGEVRRPRPERLRSRRAGGHHRDRSEPGGGRNGTVDRPVGGGVTLLDPVGRRSLAVHRTGSNAAPVPSGGSGSGPVDGPASMCGREEARSVTGWRSNRSRTGRPAFRSRIRSPGRYTTSVSTIGSTRDSSSSERQVAMQSRI